MKTFLLALFLMLSLAVSSQKIFQEKIGVGYSYFTPTYDYINEATYRSRGNLTFGLLSFNLDKKLSLRKEVEFEWYRMRGSEDTGGLGGHSYYSVKGYAFVFALKLQPTLKINRFVYAYGGPLAASNLTTHWNYHESWSYYDHNFHQKSGERNVSESADKYFSRYFWGLEGGIGRQASLKNGNWCNVEFSVYYYFNYNRGIDSINQFDRFGFRFGIVNPTGLLFKKKVSPVE
jgi:hypothetical protein